MMKKDKLYTANKWNQPLFMDTNRVGNIFSGVDFNSYGWTPNQMNAINSYPVANTAANYNLGTYQAPGFQVADTSSIQSQIAAMKPVSAPTTSSGNGVNWGELAASAAGSLAPMATPLISDGYSTGGVGEGIAAAGSAVGDAVGMIPGVGTLAAPIVKIGSAIAGGLVNRTWGTKKNQKNINAITENATNARNTGNALVNATSSGDFMDTAGSMTSSLGFKTTDLVKGGWAGSAKRKARKQGQKFLNAEKGALAAQTHGMMMGAENVDSNLDDAVMENFFDFGGPVGFSPMTGALGIMQTDKYINAINNRTNAIARNNTLVNTSSSFSPLGNAFALGGEVDNTWTLQDESNYNEWRNALPSNLSTEINDYDLRGAYKAGLQPSLEKDGKYHLGSRDPKTGRILKKPFHPTYLTALANDAAMGYYPIIDSKGNTYTETWEGNKHTEGGSIHIKPSHRGLFTEKANRAGMGVQAFASHVLANKEDYPSSTVKQANFVNNAAGWKHDAGGSFEGAFLDEFGKDPLGAVMRYNQGLEAMAAQREAQQEAAAKQAAYDDLQKRVLAAETQNQGLQSMLDSQGLTIQALMEAQKANTNYADDWKERMGQAADDVVANSSSIVSNAADKNKNWQYIKNRLKASGKFNDTQIEGIKLNLQRESGFNWQDRSGDNGSAWGLAQWHKPRRPKDMSFDGQINHLIDTLYNYDGTDHWIGKDNYKGFMNARTPEEAHYYIAKGWERPADSILEELRVASDNSLKKHAFGGELGTNGTDFTTGLLEINTGSSHEDNPHEGVQLGLDEQGIPNLVEEGETVYNDYVFSNRLSVPSFMRKQLGLGGSMKDEITFAAASKKIAEAGKERPNNPMDMDYMDDALGKLAQVQEAERMRMQAERQNDEMERINALPVEGMMQGAMGIEAACGGKINRFAKGGEMDNRAYQTHHNWLIKNHPEIDAETRGILADMMSSGNYGNPSSAYKSLVSGLLQTPSAVSKRFNKLSEAGISDESAWKLVKGKSSGSIYAAENEKKKYEYVMSHKPGAKEISSKSKVETPQEVNKVRWGRSQNGLQTRINPDGSVWYKSLNNGNYYRTEQLALNAGKPVTKKNSVENSTKEPASTQSVATANNRPNSRINAGDVTPASARTAINDLGIIAPNSTVENGTWNLNNFDWLNNRQYQAGNQGIPYSRNAAENDIRNIENSDSYKAWTDYVLNNWNNPEVQNYLRELDARAGGNHLFGNNVGEEEARQYFRDARNDGRWGYYHLTPEMIAAQAASNNGNGVVSDAAAAGPFPEDATQYGDPEAMAAAQAYGAGNDVDEFVEIDANGNPINPAGNQNTDSEGRNGKVKPYQTWMRYAPVVGTGIMTLTDLLGLTNKPDYTYANKIEAAANRLGYAPNIQYKPIGNYLRYSPMDIWAEQNRLNANSRATDRAILNSGAVQGSKMAGLLANGYNDQLASGQLYRQALEYNDNKRHQVADFNRRTDMFNSQMGLKADMANAKYRQQAASAQLNGLAQAAAMRDAIDNRIGAARSANITNLLNNLGNIGRENFAMNQINSDRTRPYKGRLNGTSYYYNGTSAFGGEIERYKKNKKQGRRSK